MTSYQDFSNPPPKWLEDLIEKELYPEKQSLKNSQNMQANQLLEESSIEFLNQLQNHFLHFIHFFNKYSENSEKFKEIRLFQIAQTPADFMLYRNQIKLLITNPLPGTIHFTFAHHIREQVPGSTQTLGTAQELHAKLDPFRDITWHFQEHIVQPKKVAQFYFSEFIRLTRTSSSKTKEKLLLEQIKTLLQQKGLQL